MSSKTLIYDAVVWSGSSLESTCVAGTCFGVVGHDVLDGDYHRTGFIHNAWVDEQGIGFVDVNGVEYVVIDFETREPSNPERHRYADLFALALLGAEHES
ncbi:hypothetical protein [Pseudomonas sp. T8]|uniref:hypothetical protein n=1 Tax=Pseudomonas sp. T8 TaxID=645292 RepID=UPI002147E6DF|nr:hypothetical protein [Pseudomonas sp. T8]UUT24050.1 hypothetical protein NRG23_08815 [Pseudomonas sp. T8]